MSKLDAAIEAILAGEPYRDEWTALCVAAVRLGAAFAEFDAAKKRYLEAQKATAQGPSS